MFLLVFRFLTNAITWTFSERQISIVVSLGLLVFSESLRVELFWLWVVSGVMVEPDHIYEGRDSFGQDEV